MLYSDFIFRQYCQVTACDGDESDDEVEHVISQLMTVRQQTFKKAEANIASAQKKNKRRPMITNMMKKLVGIHE